MPILGRLGLETARVPHVDRHGLMWLGRGKLYVEDGTLRFRTAGSPDLARGDYGIPFQLISCIMMGPGGNVTHDAVRLLARHGAGLVFVGEDCTRFYASMPFGPNDSALARKQVTAWADEELRKKVVKRMYAIRLGEIMPDKNLNALRGLEGARMKETYRILAERHKIPWRGRRYDRQNPTSADVPNRAINYASSGVEAAAMIAVATTGTIPQLGFIHEDASVSFALDLSDLFRDTVLIPVAFQAARHCLDKPSDQLERVVRRLLGQTLRKEKVIPEMIDAIKKLLEAS